VGCDLKEANLEKATLVGANLEKAILVKAKLVEAILLEASAFNAELEATDFEKAQLGAASLLSATGKAIFTGATTASLTQVEGILGPFSFPGSPLKEPSETKPEAEAREKHEAEQKYSHLTCPSGSTQEIPANC